MLCSVQSGLLIPKPHLNYFLFLSPSCPRFLSAFVRRFRRYQRVRRAGFRDTDPWAQSGSTRTGPSAGRRGRRSRPPGSSTPRSPAERRKENLISLNPKSCEVMRQFNLLPTYICFERMAFVFSGLQTNTLDWLLPGLVTSLFVPPSSSPSALLQPFRLAHTVLVYSKRIPGPASGISNVGTSLVLPGKD